MLFYYIFILEIGRSAYMLSMGQDSVGRAGFLWGDGWFPQFWLLSELSSILNIYIIKVMKSSAFLALIVAASLGILILLYGEVNSSLINSTQHLPYQCKNYKTINHIIVSLQQNSQNLAEAIQMIQTLQNSKECNKYLYSKLSSMFPQYLQNKQIVNDSQKSQNTLAAILSLRAAVAEKQNKQGGQQRSQAAAVRKQSMGYSQSTNFNIRKLQAQIINQNLNTQNIQSNTQTASSQTTYANQNGQQVSESSLSYKNDVQVDTQDQYKLNVDKDIPVTVTSVPSMGVNLKGLGFSFPDISGGLFTQTVTNTGRSTATKTVTNNVANTTTSKNTAGQVVQQAVSAQKNLSKVINTTTNSNQTTFTTQKPKNPQGFSQTPNATIDSKTTYNTQFSGIEFYHQIPTNFIYGELFNFRGKTTRNYPSTYEIPINIMFRKTTSSETFSCSQILEAGVKQFDFVCKIQKTGDYYLSAFAGSTGLASSTVRKVLTSVDRTIPQASKPEPVTGLKYKFTNNQLFFEWDSRQPITKITISQKNSIKQYLFSNFMNTLKINVEEFADFKVQEKTIFSIQEARAQSGSAQQRNSQFSDPSQIQFIALQHQYAEIQDTFDVKPIPWILPKNSEITISGKASVSIKNSIVIVDPQNKFQQYMFVDNDKVMELPANLNVSKTIKFPLNGNYILEVNDAQGKAVLNRPVYIFTEDQKDKIPGIPLVPDFQSLKPKVSSISQILNTQPKTKTEREKLMLDLINQKRQEFKVQKVVLDDKLTQLAQFYASDMVRRGFSGHYNPEGDGPGERARIAGIYTPIGQNLAMNPNITDAHYRLSRSSIHLKVMTSPQWTRVGLGFAQYPNGAFRIVQQYSTQDMDENPIPTEQIQQHRQQIIKDIIKRHPNIKNQNLKLSSIIKNWQNSSRTLTLAQALQAANFNSYSFFTVKMTYNKDFSAKIIEKTIFNDTSGKRKQVGGAIKMLEKGIAEVYIAFI